MRLEATWTSVPPTLSLTTLAQAGLSSDRACPVPVFGIFTGPAAFIAISSGSVKTTSEAANLALEMLLSSLRRLSRVAIISLSFLSVELDADGQILGECSCISRSSLSSSSDSFKEKTVSGIEKTVTVPGARDPAPSPATARSPSHNLCGQLPPRSDTFHSAEQADAWPWRASGPAARHPRLGRLLDLWMRRCERRAELAGSLANPRVVGREGGPSPPKR